MAASNVELDRLFGVKECVASAIDVHAALDEVCLEKIVANTDTNMNTNTNTDTPERSVSGLTSSAPLWVIRPSTLEQLSAQVLYIVFVPSHALGKTLMG